MGGPIHNLALDKAGTRVALSYGSDVAVVEQHAICELKFASSDDDEPTNRDSRLDERTESP